MGEAHPAGESVPPLTERQSAIVGAFTGVLCGPFTALQEYAEQVLGRPIWTHEFGGTATPEELKDAARADFLAICCQPDSDKPHEASR